MKKIILTLFAVMFLAGIAFANPEKKQVIDTTLDDDPTSITGNWNTSDYERVAFYVDYDETEVGNSVSITITADISHDGSNWIDASFYDFAGGTTLQTSEVLSADGYYVGWLPDALQVPYTRISIAGTNTDADDTAEVDGFIAGIY